MKISSNSFAPLVASALLAAVVAGCASSQRAAPVIGRDGQPAATSTAAVAAATDPDSYVVKAGDTLYSIARDHGMDRRELISLNGIDNPNRITVGQVLKIRPSVSTSPVTSEAVVARPIDSGSTVEQRPLGAAAGSSDRLKRLPLAGKEAYSDQALARAQSPDQPKSETAVAPKSEASGEARATDAPATGGDELAWSWPASGKTVGTYGESGNKGVDIAGKAGDPVLAAADGKVVYSGTGLRGYGKLVILKHNATYLSAYAHNQTILVKEGQSVTKGQKIAEMGNSDADQVKLHFEVRRQGKPVDPMKYLPPR